MFEETDHAGDEVVLMKLLELSALCLRCEVGALLWDGSIMAVYHKCLAVSTEENRWSSLLRSTADNTVAHVVLVVFSRARNSSATALAATAEGEGGGDGGETTSGGIGDREDGDCAWPHLSDDDEEARGRKRGKQAPGRAGGGAVRGRAPIADEGAVGAVGAATSVAAAEGVGVGIGAGAGKGAGVGAGPAAGPVAGPAAGPAAGPEAGPAAGPAAGLAGSAAGLAAGGDSAVVRIMSSLSVLCNPRSRSGRSCVLALSLVNIALEAGGEHLGRCALCERRTTAQCSAGKAQ